MRIACSLAARRPEPPMRPMIRLGNLNARPSCPAAAPGSTVWVYLYAAGHRDMPGDSPAGNRRCAGPGRRTENLRTPVPMKTAAPWSGRRADGMAWAGNLPAGTGAACRFTGHTPVPSQTAAPWSGTEIYTCMNRTLRSRTHLQGIHQRHRKTAARKTGGGWICGRLRR